MCQEYSCNFSRYSNSISIKTLLILFALLVLFTAGCDDNYDGIQGEAADGSSGIEIESVPPNFLSTPLLTLGPNETTPLSGLLDIQTDEPTTVKVTISENTADNSSLTRAAFESTTIEFDELSTSHSLPILGLSPDTSFNMGITITDASLNQTTFDQLILFSTPPLPQDFPVIDATVDQELVEPGVTLITLRPFGSIQDIGTYLAILNNNGQVIWYHKPQDSGSITDLSRLSNGNILFILNDTTVREIDMVGNVISEKHSINNGSPSATSVLLDTDAVHHEVFEKEDGNFLALGLEARFFDNYPSSDMDPFAPTETAAVVGDEVLEYSPDGTLINKWKLLDIIDPYRIGYNALLGLWDWVFPEIESGTRDWSHGNAVIHDTSDNSIIVSLRHQDAVVKFSAETGELIWILGPHENWDQEIYGEYLLTPVGDDFIWQYHQHAPMITPEGTLLLFDNGNWKASPFDERLFAPENFSRAVEYFIDQESMEVHQVWEYGQLTEEIIFTPFIGDADYLPETGNVLITFGGITLDAEGIPTDNVQGSDLSARIIEVTHTTPAQKVLDISISDKEPSVGKGWITYRSEKLPSIYP